MNIKIVVRNIDDLIPADYNPRQMSEEQDEALEASLREFGFVDPAIINKHPDRMDVIIGGHQRIRKWRDMGNKKVPTVELNLEYEKERELNIRLNRGGDWDWDILGKQFDVDDLKEYGFTDKELEFSFPDYDDGKGNGSSKGEDDIVVRAEIQTDIVEGDLIMIGQHRLYCGDSTDQENLYKLMVDAKPDIVIADPPYGIEHTGKGIKGDAAPGDFGTMLGDEDVTVAIKSFKLCQEKFADSVLMFWGANYYASVIPNGFGWLIWDKQREGDTFSGAELAFVNKSVKVNVFRHQWHGMIKESERGEKRLHSTQKPVALFDYSIDQYCPGAKVVADLFAGSGSVMVSCEKRNQMCYSMELDPVNCQIIIDRMVKLNPKIEVKINGRKYKPETPIYHLK